ncbi:hypothetical protein SDC9_70488 [bioreactor metagenome]|uniref:Uncharacterized protein n=1 Tax=bioreactor metagenome TaxID=1076179 RepID=A0A644Y7U9_9ZZZZ
MRHVEGGVKMDFAFSVQSVHHGEIAAFQNGQQVDGAHQLTAQLPPPGGQGP